MKKISNQQKKWENRHQTFIEKINDLITVGNEQGLDTNLKRYNDTTIGLQSLIGDAIKANKPLRSLGAGWSWTKIATAQGGIMIDTKQLNLPFILTAKSIVPEYKGDYKKLLFAQCGMGIWELNDRLRERKLSLKTCGASNGQTIVGAMSTGTHGSAIDVGAVSDYVVGMHIILGPDRHVWLERESQPIASDSFLKNLKTTRLPGTNDDLFNAALVSFGSFGIIHGVMLETDDLYLLETNSKRVPYENALRKMMETLDFTKAKNLTGGTERPYYFSVTLNPYDIENGAYVYTQYKRPYQDDYQRPVPNDAGIGPGDDAPCFIGRLTDVAPRLVPGMVNKLLAGPLKPYSKVFGTLGEIFDNTKLQGKLMSTAIGIPLNQVNRVADLLFELNDKKVSGPFTGLFAFRFVKKSRATLGFTRFDFTCILELDGIFSKKTVDFYQAVWDRLEKDNIPFTLHWGKMNNMNSDQIKRMYGKDADAWMAARNKLLDKDALKAFTNPLLTQWGLDKVV